MNMRRPDAIFLPSISSSRRRKPFLLKPRKDITLVVRKKDFDSRHLPLLQLLRLEVPATESSKSKAIHLETKFHCDTLSTIGSFNDLSNSKDGNSDQSTSEDSLVTGFPESSFHTPEPQPRTPIVPSSPPLIRRRSLDVVGTRDRSTVPEHLLLPSLF